MPKTMKGKSGTRHVFIWEAMLLRVAEATRAEGALTATKASLALLLGCNKECLARAIRKLKQDGLIAAHPTYGGSGAQKANRYVATANGLAVAERILALSRDDVRR